MEATGVLVDDKLLKIQSKEITLKLAELEQLAHEAAGHEFNLGSPKQLQQILFEELELPVIRKTPKGQPSTAEDVLQELADDYELPRLILENRGLSKLKSTYTDRLPEQICARNRSGSYFVSPGGRRDRTAVLLDAKPAEHSDPHRGGTPHTPGLYRPRWLQPAGGRLLQIELRIMAHISGDAGLLKAFAEDRDIHKATAAEVFGVELDAGQQRPAAFCQSINFGLIYGMSAFGLAKQLGIGRHEAQDYVNLYFERYPGVAAYMEQTRELAKEQGYVETVFGQQAVFTGYQCPTGAAAPVCRTQRHQRTHAGHSSRYHQAGHAVCERMDHEEQPDARLIMQVHDELVLEVRQ